MADVSCNTINDLLPLYLDEVLSEDSKVLVEAHLNGCAACGARYHELTETKLPLQRCKAAEDQRTLKGIRQTIRRRKLRAGCLAACLVALLAFGLYYFLAVMDFYVPYEKSGLFMDGTQLKTKNRHHYAFLSVSPDGSTAFVYMTATKQEEGTPIHGYYPEFLYNSAPKQFITEESVFCLDEIEPPKQLDEQGKVVQVFDAPTALYYVSRRYANQLSDGTYWCEGDEAEQLQTLIADSTLIWKAEQ